jgi:hypothetical protein
VPEQAALQKAPKVRCHSDCAAALPTVIVKCDISNHLNLKFSRHSSPIDRQPISFMSRSISL